MSTTQSFTGNTTYSSQWRRHFCKLYARSAPSGGLRREGQRQLLDDRGLHQRIHAGIADKGTAAAANEKDNDNNDNPVDWCGLAKSENSEFVGVIRMVLTYG